jgi:hypothetical protein
MAEIKKVTLEVSQVTVYGLQGASAEGHPPQHNSLAELVARRRQKIRDTVQSGKLTEYLAAEMNTDLDSLLNKFEQYSTDADSPLTAQDRSEIQEKLNKIDGQLFHARTIDSSSNIASVKKTGRIIDLYG